MNTIEATPRVNAAFLEHFKHQTVRIMGKVIQLRGEQATLEANGSVQIFLNREAHLALNHYAEIVGKVTNDLTVRAFAATDVGTTIDMNAVDAVIDWLCADISEAEAFYGVTKKLEEQKMTKG